MTRTYGTLVYDETSDTWQVTAEPAVAMRFKRAFRRVQATRTGTLTVKNTLEIARDLEWFNERFPFQMDEDTQAALTTDATAHRQREQDVANILARENFTPLTLAQPPARPARDYQTAAVELLRARKSLLLTDDLGLGKTFTGLLATAPDDARPALVVPPTHLPGRWLTEAADSFPHLNIVVGEKTTPSEEVLAGNLPDVLILPYSRLAGWADALAGKVKTVVFDEAQELRNGTATQKGVAAGRVADGADYVLGLTATPIYNYGDEIHSVLDIIANGELGTRQEFTREWCTGGLHARVSEPEVLGSYLRENGLMLGRSREDVNRELPSALRIPHVVDSDPSALDAVRDDIAELARRILDDSVTRQERFLAAGDIDWKLRQATGIAKAPYVAAFVKMVLASEKKVILFGWHREVYDIWMDELAEFNPVMYTGSENPTQKARAEKTFKDDDSCRIIIMSLRSGAGIDGLQEHARVVVFGELDWSPMVHTQGIGRARRDGMDESEPVLAYFLHTVDGSDPALLEALGVKKMQADGIVNPDAPADLPAGAGSDTARSRALAEAFLQSQVPGSQ